MKKLLILVIISTALSCKKEKANCVYSNGQGDYWKTNEYTKAQAEQQCSCTVHMECPD